MAQLEAILSPLASATRDLLRGLEESVVLVRAGEGHGSGVAWPHHLDHLGAGSLIVTNHHVAHSGRSRSIQIETREGQELAARIIARDEPNDLALLWAEDAELAVAPVGDSRGLRVGELIVALGHPWGVRNMATLGIISGVGSRLWSEAGIEAGRFGPRRVAMRPRELLQADVALAPGNSGGPLADASGRVVGIACMIAAPGIALAIPAHLVERLAGALEEKPKS